LSGASTSPANLPASSSNGRGDVAVEIAVMAGFHGRLQAGAMVEREQDVRDRRAVGHAKISL